MAIYLKKFETQAAYEAAQSGLILPNVSLITETNGVAYNPYVDPSAGHEYIEIGGIKWATMNIGAESVTNWGIYFAWGEVSGYTYSQIGSTRRFDWENYKYCNGTSEPGTTGMTKYNDTDGKTALEISDDAARVYWGGKWRLPTAAEFQTLGNSVNTAWTSSYQSSGIPGMVLTDKSDSSKELFFPASGYGWYGSGTGMGNYVYCWSSSLYTDEKNKAYNLYFNNSYPTWNNTATRNTGYNIRAVLDV